MSMAIGILADVTSRQCVCVCGMRLERTEQVKPLNCCAATHQIQTAHLCNGLTCSWTVPKTMKRSRHASSSEDSDNGSNSTCWSQHSKSQPRRGKGTKPSEVFRTDFITAMKVHDSHQLNQDEYYILADPWRQEWEKGVQVPVSPQSIPHPVARVLAEKGKEVMFTKPKKMIRISRSESLGYVDIRTLAEGTCRYDLDEEDVAWIQIINEEFTEMGIPVLDEITMERVIEEFECRCHDNMTHAMETEEGLGIEYDEDVVCDVCQSPDGEDNNEMVFCDKCNICVHQACYGIQKVPKGSWLCRICALGILPKCQLCPKKGGAMKPTRSGTKWVHVSCALWIPEVSIGNPEKMEPITNVNHIPSNRWALICCVCKEKRGACIQCSAKNCRTAFHVTCGLSASLEMNTILTEDDEVKFKSYCPKHSGLQGSEARDSGGEEEEKEVGDGDKKGKRRGRVREEDDEVSSSYFAPPELPSSKASTGEAEALSSQQQEEKRVNLRKMKLQALEEEFFQFVDVEEVAQHLKLSQEAVDFMYQYWKLKRKANFNQPLLTPKKDEEESLARREQEVLLRRLQLFTHLRQDLERVRNLTYMVTRREKMKRSLWRVQEQIFHHQVRLLDHELLIGDASAKDLEKIFSLGWLSSQGSQSGSSWGQSSLKTKRGTSKHERRKGLHRKHLPNYPQPQKDGSSSNPLDTKDGDGEKLKESVTVEVNAYSRVQNMDDGQGFQEFHYSKGQKAEVREDANHVKVQRPENRPEPRREAPWPEPHHKVEQEVRSKEEELALTRQKQESDDEDEEEKRRRKKRKNEPTDCRPIQTKIRLGLKPLEKTVSIRLVDIRASDFDEYSKNTGTASKSLLTADPYTNVSTKANKNHSAPDSFITKPGKASVILEHCGSSTKTCGLLRKPPANNSSSSSSHSASNGHLKNWGKFRIPKRSERPPGVAKEKQEGGAIDPASLQEHQRKSFLKPPANTTDASYPRTRLRTGAENEVFTPSSNAKPSDDEVDHCLKRCHSHQLRGDASITRRYGNNIIRRGVLAS